MDRGGRSQMYWFQFRVFCDVLAYVSCRGYVCILLRGSHRAANQGGTADRRCLFVLDVDREFYNSVNVEDVFLFNRKVLENSLLNKNKMSTGTRRKCQLKLTVLGKAAQSLMNKEIRKLIQTCLLC